MRLPLKRVTVQYSVTKNMGPDESKASTTSLHEIGPHQIAIIRVDGIPTCVCDANDKANIGEGLAASLMKNGRNKLRNA